MPEYERVLAGEIQVGDRVARTRTAIFCTVTGSQRNAETVWLSLARPDGANAGRSRPRVDARWWREVASC